MAAVKVSPPPKDCKDPSLKHVHNVLSKRGVTPGKTHCCDNQERK